MRLHNVRRLDGRGLSDATTVDLAGDGEDRDAGGLILSPGWVDLHAHLRDPGFVEKETLASGAASAAFGGFTHVVAMANTNPAIDDPGRLGELVARAADLPIRVSFVGAVTVNLEGKALTDARAMQRAGAVALSDDGRHAMDRSMLGAALQAAADAGLPLFIHAQKEALGRRPDAEIEGIAEALEVLPDAPGARLHVQHVSTAAAVDLLRQAKHAGLSVTAEATPHHLALTADDVAGLGPMANVSPPLRNAADREAVVAALVEGVIDVIATDHAPHDAAAKAAGANGFHGFETAIGVVMGLGLDPGTIYRACVERPAQILSLPLAERDGEGLRDWILIDPDLEWTVDPGSFRSRGRNTPFAGRRLNGRVVMTVRDGHILFERMVQRV